MSELTSKPRPAEDIPPPVAEPKPTESKWGFKQGDEIVPGRTAIERLGGGYRYEAYLAWDDHLRSLVVIKVVRPGLVEDSSTLRGLASEVELLERLDIPCSCAASAPTSRDPGRTWCSSISRGPACRRCFASTVRCRPNS